MNSEYENQVTENEEDNWKSQIVLKYREKEIRKKKIQDNFEKYISPLIGLLLFALLIYGLFYSVFIYRSEPNYIIYKNGEVNVCPQNFFGSPVLSKAKIFGIYLSSIGILGNIIWGIILSLLSGVFIFLLLRYIINICKNKNKFGAERFQEIRKINLRRYMFQIFLALYAISVIMTSVIFVPKYAEYRDGNIKQRISTGYYHINQTRVVTNRLNPSGNRMTEDLKIDVEQWLIVTFVETVVLLIPAFGFFRERKK